MNKRLMALLGVVFAIQLVMNVMRAATDGVALVLAIAAGLGLVITIVLAIRPSNHPRN